MTVKSVSRMMKMKRKAHMRSRRGGFLESVFLVVVVVGVGDCFSTSLREGVMEEMDVERLLWLTVVGCSCVDDRWDGRVVRLWMVAGSIAGALLALSGGVLVAYEAMLS